MVELLLSKNVLHLFYFCKQPVKSNQFTGNSNLEIATFRAQPSFTNKNYRLKKSGVFPL